MQKTLKDFFTIKPINWVYRWTGLCSGILLMIPHIFPEASPLQMFALLPVITVLSLKKVSWYIIGATGMYLAFGYAVQQVFIIMLWPAISIPLTLYFCFLCLIITLVGTVLLCRLTLPGAIAFGALLTVVDWINFSGSALDANGAR